MTTVTDHLELVRKDATALQGKMAQARWSELLQELIDQLVIFRLVLFKGAERVHARKQPLAERKPQLEQLLHAEEIWLETAAVAISLIDNATAHGLDIDSETFTLTCKMKHISGLLPDSIDNSLKDFD